MLENQIPQWYYDLVNSARQYVSQGGLLNVIPSPTGAYQWFNAALIRQEIMNEVDTQGLDQLGPQQPIHQVAYQHEYEAPLY